LEQTGNEKKPVGINGNAPHEERKSK